MSRCAGHPDETALQKLLLHFYVGLVLGLSAVIFTSLLHTSAVVTALDRAGADRVQKIFVGGDPPLPTTSSPAILLDFVFPRAGNGAETDRLADAILRLAAHEPRAIIVDQEITSAVDAAVVRRFIAAVNRAADAGTQVVLMPSLESTALNLSGPVPVVSGPIDGVFAHPSGRVVRASPILHPDADGVIRRFRTADCVTVAGQTQPLPTFAGSLAHHAPDQCGTHAHDAPIRYVVSQARLASSERLVVVPIADEADLDAIDDRVRGRVVIMGETAPSGWNDVHATPLGPMPGTLIHANILLSPQEDGFDAPVFSAGTVTYVLLAALALVPWFVLRRSLRSPPRLRGRWRGVSAISSLLALGFAIPIAVAMSSQHLEAAESIKLSMELASVLIAATIFAAQDVAAEYLAGALGVPEWLIRLPFFGLATILVVGGLIVLWFASGSYLLSRGLLVGSLVPAIATSGEALLKAGEHVTRPLHHLLRWLNLRPVAIVVGLLGAIGPALAAEPAPPPLSPRAGERPGVLKRSFDELVALVKGSPEAKAVRIGANARQRGGSGIPLQWLPTVPATDAALPIGAVGLTLVWTGGKPPFFVGLESEGGQALGAIQTDERVIDVDRFVMPAEPVFVRIGDEHGQPITATLRPVADPMPAPSADLVDRLVQATPDRRLDLLRQLRLTAGTNPEAARAIDLIRRTADNPP